MSEQVFFRIANVKQYEFMNQKYMDNESLKR